ncbi:MAG TPA: CDGSH iron-sulfur domain-containing protein, partial [Streptosporangiaceae bacterium]
RLALCRCGSSAIKPLCDGACARTGFADAKDPKRVPDRRDAYLGQQLTIFDNRGICQHSGYCTDRLATVFRAGQEPFVAPSGGRLDEIIRAVRDCPSGALSLAFGTTEARGLVDWDGAREPAIEVTKDGPYRITGGIALTDADGQDVPRNAGSSAEHYALCRCGQSQNKPFCSGMHWYVGFRDPVTRPGHEPTLFEWAGGLPALTRMTRLLYERHVPADPLLAPLFAEMRPDHPAAEASWLGEVLGGPARHGQDRGGYPPLAAGHADIALAEQQRARWVSLVNLSADETGMPADPEFRTAFCSCIEWVSGWQWRSRSSPAQSCNSAARRSRSRRRCRAGTGARLGRRSSRMRPLAAMRTASRPRCRDPARSRALPPTSGTCSASATSSR